MQRGTGVSPRLRVTLALAALVILGVLATLAGERRTRRPDDDVRRSTFVYGPHGASAWADGLVRVGVDVERVRDAELLLPDSASRARTLVATLEPGRDLDPFEGGALAAHAAHGGSVLLAGPSARPAMRCLGYDPELLTPDSLRAAPLRSRAGPEAPWVSVLLVPRPADTVVDTVEAVSGVIATCAVPRAVDTDTLLVVAGNRLVAVELRLDGGGRAILVADDRLFSNRRLRATDAGPFTLGLVAGRFDSVRVDEFHHGYGAGGNLAGTLFAWSAESPWGWAVWQLALVGVLAVLAGALRFGPPVPLDEQRRRSPLEHVRALATALAAARGHDIAIALLVQGLRRRLARTGTVHRAPPREWIESLAPHLRTPRAQAAAASLVALTLPQQPAESVLRAASAVEDLWEELRP